MTDSVSGLPLILTIGHWNRTLEAFIGLLTAHNVSRLVDVRKMPRSAITLSLTAKLYLPAWTRLIMTICPASAGCAVHVPIQRIWVCAIRPFSGSSVTGKHRHLP